MERIADSPKVRAGLLIQLRNSPYAEINLVKLADKIDPRRVHQPSPRRIRSSLTVRLFFVVSDNGLELVFTIGLMPEGKT